MSEHARRRRPDANQLAHALAQSVVRLSGEPPPPPDPEPQQKKNPAAVALGRLGGRKGGKARAAALTPERRAEIAREASRARWKDRD